MTRTETLRRPEPHYLVGPPESITELLSAALERDAQKAKISELEETVSCKSNELEIKTAIIERFSSEITEKDAKIEAFTKGIENILNYTDPDSYVEELLKLVLNTK